MTRKLFFESGTPAFSNMLYLSRPFLADRQIFHATVDAIFDSKWLTNDGVCVRDLESKIAKYHDVKNCVAVCNGTIALEIAMRAMGLGGEVIMPSFTFIATAHAAHWSGLTPVFGEVDGGLTLDIADAQRRITPRTTALLPVNLFGNACDFDGINSLAHKHGLKVLYDSAHCFGGSYKNKMFGGFGDAEALSFHATKIFHTFEGGAILTNDDDLADKCRLSRNFGFSGYDQIDAVGTNGKMNELSAAQGLLMLPEVDSLIEQNRERHFFYKEELANIPGISFLPFADGVEPNYHYFPIFIDESFGVSRDIVYRLLWKENVMARRYFYPGCHRVAPYSVNAPSLPFTEKALDQILCLPVGNEVKLEDIKIISAIIAAAHEKAAAVKSWADQADV